MGPEDLLGGDSYGMWEYGGPVHKNLQYLKNIAADPEALKALDFYVFMDMQVMELVLPDQIQDCGIGGLKDGLRVQLLAFLQMLKAFLVLEKILDDRDFWRIS